MKDFTNSKIAKVNCDFCGKDMECPEEMLKTSKSNVTDGLSRKQTSQQDNDKVKYFNRLFLFFDYLFCFF